MKMFIAILTITTLNFCSIFASNLIFYPMPTMVGVGDTLKIEFSGNIRFIDRNEIDLLYYLFDERSIYPKGDEVKLLRDQNKWSGSIVIPEGTVYIMFKVFAAGDYIDIIDNNNGKYWEYLVKATNADGVRTAVRGANLKAALSRLGTISANIDRLPDYHEAIKHLEYELKQYPDNIAAELGLLTTLFDTKKISNDSFKKQIEEIANRIVDINNESAVRSKSRALNSINENDEAMDMENEFSRRFPNSEIAEDKLISEISRAGSLNDFIKSSKIFFNRFPNSINRERVFLAYISGYLQSNKVNELIADLDTMSNVPSYAYARIARSIFEYNKTRNTLNDSQNRLMIESLLEKAESLTKKLSKANDNEKPKIYTPGEWLDILDVRLGTIYELKAEYYQFTEPINAVPLFESALTLLRNSATENLYENYIQLLVTLGDSAKALDLSEKALVNGKISYNITEFHRELCRNLLYLNDSTYNLKADSIYQKSKLVKNEIYFNEILDQDEFQYTLETLDGTYIDFRDLKGKVLLIYFFASWCDPCLTMFPAFQEIYQLYSENPNVEIVAVSTLENSNFTNETLKRFVVQSNVGFPIARDVMDIIPRQMGINGLPTIAIFDRDSHVRFLVRGFSSNEKLLDELSGRIEFLLDIPEN